MHSDVSVVNIALVRLGEKTIISLDDANDRARAAKAIYEDLRDEVLTAFPWPFAIARAVLNKLTTPVPSYEFAAYFQLPTDPACLHVLDTDDDTFPWRREGNQLASNRDAVSIRYLARIVDPKLFSPLFAHALAYRLAADLAQAIAGKEALGLRMYQMYERLIARARGSANREQGNRPHPGTTKEHAPDIVRPLLDVR